MEYAVRKGIQLFVPFSESRLFNSGRYRSSWSPPWAIQRKLDGERCRAIVTSGRCLLLSSSEAIISSVPHINTYLAKHFPDGEYDGELYKHGWTQSEIHSVVSTTSSMHRRYEELEYHVFDVKNKKVQATRIEEYYKLPFGGPIKRVETYLATTMNQIMNFYDQFIAEGYEGFIIRELSSMYVERRSQLGMKYKPKQVDHYEIVSVYEAVSDNGTPKGMIGGFNCIDDMGTHFKVGAGKLTHDERTRIWLNIQEGMHYGGLMLRVEYQSISSKNKVPNFSRAVKVLMPE